MASKKGPKLTAAEQKELARQLTWTAGKDFQVEPVRGPLRSSPKKTGRWIVRVRIGAAQATGSSALFEVVIREDSRGYFSWIRVSGAPTPVRIAAPKT